MLPENGFDIARLLTGTEETCAVVVGATLALVPAPKSTLLVALGYRTVSDAAADVPEILRFRPTSIEGMDQAIVDTMRQRRGPESVGGLPAGRSTGQSCLRSRQSVESVNTPDQPSAREPN